MKTLNSNRFLQLELAWVVCVWDYRSSLRFTSSFYQPLNPRVLGSFHDSSSYSKRAIIWTVQDLQLWQSHSPLLAFVGVLVMLISSKTCLKFLVYRTILIGLKVKTCTFIFIEACWIMNYSRFNEDCWERSPTTFIKNTISIGMSLSEKTKGKVMRAYAQSNQYHTIVEIHVLNVVSEPCP